MNIFKKIVFSTLLFTGSTLCYAQEISIRGGFNLSKISFKEGSKVIEGIKLNPGFSLGPIFELPLNSKLSAETGILFSSKGYKQSGGDPSGEYNYTFTRKLFYSEVPVSIKASFPMRNDKIFGMIGPYVACGLFGYDTTKGNGINLNPNEKTYIKWGSDEYYKLDRLDYGLKFGGGIKIKKIQIGVSYGLGLKNFSNNGILKQKNRVLEFYVAYKVKNFKREVFN